MPRQALIDIMLTGEKRNIQNDGLHVSDRSPSPAHAQYQ